MAGFYSWFPVSLPLTNTKAHMQTRRLRQTHNRTETHTHLSLNGPIPETDNGETLGSRRNVFKPSQGIYMRQSSIPSVGLCSAAAVTSVVVKCSDSGEVTQGHSEHMRTVCQRLSEHYTHSQWGPKYPPGHAQNPI